MYSFIRLFHWLSLKFKFKFNHFVMCCAALVSKRASDSSERASEVERVSEDRAVSERTEAVTHFLV
jgi:hypothetical protein